MSPVELEDAKEHLDELVEQAARGEEVVIARNHQPLVRLVPVQGRKKRKFGSAKGLIEIADDFDEPLSQLVEEALAEHRAGLTQDLDPDRL